MTGNAVKGSGRSREPDAEALLWDALAAQVQAVDARVGAARSYTHESLEVRRAALEVPVLRRQLGLLRYMGNLTPSTGKPQYLLAFESGPNNGDAGIDGTGCVLKVYGRRRPGEAALQSHWSLHGLPTPRVYCYADDPVSWLLLEHVAADVVTAPSKDALLVLTQELALVMGRIHAEGAVAVERARSLAEGVMPHLVTVMATLVRHGYDVPTQWQEAAWAAYAAGRPVSLHGDLFPGNLLRADRGLLLVDACGYLGDASFDAARWAVRVSTPDCSSEQVLQTWLQVEIGLDPRTARVMLAAESLMQAGVREIMKDEMGQPAHGIDAVTIGLVGDCTRLWDMS